MERTIKKKILIASVVLIILVFFIASFMIFVSNKKFNDNSLNKIDIAANKYFSDHGYDIDEYAEVSVQTLVNENYLSKEDVTTEQLNNGIVSISNTSSDNNSSISVGYTINTNSYDTNVTIGDYNATINTYSSSSNTIFQSYIDEETGEQIFKIDNIESAHSRFMLTVSGDNIKKNPHNIFVVRAQVKTENITYSQTSPKGANLMVMYHDNGYSWGFSHEDVLDNSSEWKTIDVVVIPEYNVETETKEDATIPLYLALGGTLSSEYVAGTAYFKNIEIINAEDETDVLNLNDDEKLDITYSENNRIKYVSYSTQRVQNDFTTTELQERVNVLGEVYESYAELVGNSSSGKLLYPYKANTLVIIQTNKLQIGYGGLANYPIMLTYNGAINIYNGTDRSFEFGILHEMGHTFDHILTSDDGTVNNGGGKWNFHSEMWANMKIFYALYTKNVTAISGSENRDYFELLEIFKPTEVSSFSHDNLDYFIYNSITDYDNKTVNFEVKKKVHQWFNDSEFSFSDVSRRLIYYLAKLDEYSNNSFKNSVTESYLDIVADYFNIISATSKNVDSVVQIQNITTIPLNSYAIKPFIIKEGVNDVVFYSSDESIATIDENGVVKTFDKEGTVTFTVKSYFNDVINKSLEIKILGNNGDKVWDISKDASDSVYASLNEETGVLRIVGTGEVFEWYSSGRPWADYQDLIKKVIVEEGVTSLGANMFNTVTTIESIEMADSVTNIGVFFCPSCTSLKEVKLSKNLVSLGDRAFYSTPIENIDLPDTIEHLGELVFRSCNNIKYINVPKKTITYGKDNFKYALLNIPVVFAGEEVVEIENFDLISRIYDSNDVLYSSGTLTFDKIKYDETTKLVSMTLEDAKKGNATIQLPSDTNFLSGLTIKFVPEIIPLSEIIIEKAPNKVSYKVGETFEQDGMIVKAVYQSTSGKVYYKEINNYTLSGHDNLSIGENVITVTYTNNGVTKTTTLVVTVTEKLKVELGDLIETETGNLKYIEKISPKTTVKNLKDSIKTNGDIKVYKNSFEINDEQKLSTGMNLKIKLNDEELNYILIVKGELDGDNEVGTTDLLKLYRYVLGTININEPHYLKAAQINKDEEINTGDILRLYRYVNGLIDNL